ncbi:MAG TPA: hypothetical protein VNO32_14415, partial [Candidatus Acidoferrum sp.]|nr:hypothetical protein [Candidatus Acidoferrum sp.]
VTKTAVKESIGKAFVFGFRIVMLVCAGLSLASATVAWLMILQDRIPTGLGSDLGTAGPLKSPFQPPAPKT